MQSSYLFSKTWTKGYIYGGRGEENPKKLHQTQCHSVCPDPLKTEQAETWDTSSHIRKRGFGPWDNSIDFRARYECILCLALEQGQARAIPHQQCSGLLPLLFSSFGSSTSVLCRWFHNWLLVVGQLPACQPGYFSWDHTCTAASGSRGFPAGSCGSLRLCCGGLAQWSQGRLGSLRCWQRPCSAHQEYLPGSLSALVCGPARY